jgi:Flp pilus assembly protein TadG
MALSPAPPLSPNRREGKMKNLLTLMRLPSAATRSLGRFGRDEAGTVVAEAVIVLPLFLWAYIALFVYWDAFRSMNSVQKAAYTISDMISREKMGKTTAYITGVKRVLEYLIDEDQDARMRVTEVTWSNTNQRFEVHWSRSPGGTMTPLTTSSLQAYAYEIPTMSAGDYVIIVEVQVDYKPTFDIGMPNQTFNQFIVTRPRFVPCIPMDTAGVPNITTCPLV